MPIYAYKCTNCGHADDVLQKFSDAPLTVCPKCGQASYVKQITAPQFQLKGSGWYVTDFRGGNSAAGKKADADDKPATDKPADAKAESKPQSGDASATASPAAAKADAKTPPAQSSAASGSPPAAA
jgi:putative FmdB family regulatory protein